jgi:recombinational DNA repair protein (RecF pathway)
MTEARAGSITDAPALILGTTRYQETGKIVRVLTPEYGKLVLFAPGAVNSRKRFGAALEPLSFVTLHYRQPRMPDDGHGALPLLMKADLRDSFLHLRTHSRLLEMGIFGVKLVDEFLPEGQPDAVLFRVLGRLLRDSVRISVPDTHAPWAKVAFWNWVTRHLGYGDLLEAAGSGFPVLPAELRAPWGELMLAREPSFAEFFLQIPTRALPRLTADTDAILYSAWTRVTGLHWSHFEQWIKQSLSF